MHDRAFGLTGVPTYKDAPNWSPRTANRTKLAVILSGKECVSGGVDSGGKARESGIPGRCCDRSQTHGADMVMKSDHSDADKTRIECVK